MDKAKSLNDVLKQSSIKSFLDKMFSKIPLGLQDL